MVIKKETLNTLATAFGAIAGISTVAGTFGYVDKNLAGFIAGSSTVLLGVVSQQPSKEFKELTNAAKQEGMIN